MNGLNVFDSNLSTIIKIHNSDLTKIKDFDNIPPSDYYEHDTVYRSMVQHKTGTKLRKLEPRWPNALTKEQSDMIIKNNLFFYKTFVLFLLFHMFCS